VLTGLPVLEQEARKNGSIKKTTGMDLGISLGILNPLWLRFIWVDKLTKVCP